MGVARAPRKRRGSTSLSNSGTPVARRKWQSARIFLTHQTFKSTFLRCFYDFAHKKSVKIFF